MPRGKKIPTAVPDFGHLERREGTKNWYLVYRPQPNAKRIVRSAKTSDQQLAYEQLKDLAGKYARGDVADVATPTTCTFTHLFRLLEADYRRRNRATLDDMLARVEKHLKPAFGDTRVVQFRKAQVDSFIASRLDGFEVTDKDGSRRTETLDPGSVNKLLAYLRRAMRLGMKEDPRLVFSIPEWFPKLEEGAARSGVLSPEMYRAIRDAAGKHAGGEHIRLALAIGFHVGLRRGAILNLRWEWVDWRESVIRIPATEDRDNKLKPRIVPMYGDMLRFMEMAYITRKTGFVVEYKGKPVRSLKTGWKAAIARATAQADLDGHKDLAQALRGCPLFHDLRRTAATMMHEAGFELGDIMESCGWKSPTMPMRYIQQSVRRAQTMNRRMAEFVAKRIADGEPRSGKTRAM